MIELLLNVLQLIGGIAAIVVAAIIVLYLLAVLAAVLHSALTRKKPRRHGEQCPKCREFAVYNEPGKRVCTNCGAHEQWR